jgi:hypothetical protein
MRYQILFLTAIAALLSGCQAVSEQTPESIVVKVCTERDCGTTLTVALSGAVPDDFVLDAETPDGKVKSVKCVGGKGEYSPDHFQDMSYLECSPERVDFVNFSPNEVTITISWDNNEVSQFFTPDYRVFYPNGSDCPPECLVGRITFTVPER